MNAPEIPNLLETMRASRASQGPRAFQRGRGGRRGRGINSGASDVPISASSHSSSSTTPLAIEAQEDKIVQQTDNNAAGSRASAVEVGYLDDAFAHIFSPTPERRLPIINRGTYARTSGVDSFIEEFLFASADPSFTPLSQPAQVTPSSLPSELVRRKQIISLGAGTDTRYFRFLLRDPSLATRLVYHELDFPDTTSKKISQLQQHELHNILQVPATSILVSEDKRSLASPGYHIHGVDLRLLSTSHASNSGDGAEATPEPLNGTTIPGPTSALGILNIDPSLETLILSECCLTYMALPVSSSILSYFLDKVFLPSTSVHVVLYEPVNPHDAFGRTMMQNLASRKISMPGVQALSSIAAHMEHLKGLGFVTGQEAWEVHKWWEEQVSPAEKERLRLLEGLDEEEEWLLLASHYAFVHAWR